MSEQYRLDQPMDETEARHRMSDITLDLLNLRERATETDLNVQKIVDAYIGTLAAILQGWSADVS